MLTVLSNALQFSVYCFFFPGHVTVGAVFQCVDSRYVCMCMVRFSLSLLFVLVNVGLNDGKVFWGEKYVTKWFIVIVYSSNPISFG